MPFRIVDGMDDSGVIVMGVHGVSEQMGLLHLLHLSCQLNRKYCVIYK